MTRSYLERIAIALIKDAGLPMPIEEYKFCTDRKWRADFCWLIEGEPTKEEIKSAYENYHDCNVMVSKECKPIKKIILEIEGGIWLGSKGRHTNAMGYQKDLERANEAALLGYTVIRVTKAHMISGQMIAWLRRALGLDNEHSTGKL